MKREKKTFQKLTTIEKPKPLKKNVQNKFFKGFILSQKKAFVKGFIKKILWGIKNHVKKNKNSKIYWHI